MAEGYGYDHDCEGKGYLGGCGLLLRWCKIVKMVKRSFRLISVLFNVDTAKMLIFNSNFMIGIIICSLICYVTKLYFNPGSCSFKENRQHTAY